MASLAELLERTRLQSLGEWADNPCTPEERADAEDILLDLHFVREVVTLAALQARALVATQKHIHDTLCQEESDCHDSCNEAREALAAGQELAARLEQQ